MSDKITKDILKESRLEALTDQFEDNGIGIELLQEMDEEVLVTIVPNPIQRFLLKNALKKYTSEKVMVQNVSSEKGVTAEESGKKTPSVAYSDYTDRDATEFCTSTPTLSSSINTFSYTADCVPDISATIPSTSTEPIIYELTPVSSLKRPSPSLQTDNFDIKLLLESSCMGRAILAIYKAKGFLDSKVQGYLVDIITGQLLNGEYNRLDQREQKNIAKKIVELFPNEKEEVYFVPGVPKRNSKNNVSGRSKGKFADKYRNKLTFLRSAKVIPYLRKSAKESDSDDSDTFITVPEALSSHNDDMQWLKNNTEPWNVVQERWNNTFALRSNYLQQNVTINEILQQWPIVRHSLGYTLVDEDFSRLHGERNSIFNEFESTFNKIVNLKQGTLKETDLILLEVFRTGTSLSTDYQHYLIIQLLSAMVPSTSRILRAKGAGKAKQWKPTVQESRESIIIRSEIPGDIEQSIKKRVEKTKKLTGQEPFFPFIILDIEDNVKINNIYIALGDILYKVSSVLKGIDVCFKIFHVLNINYPCESEHLWLFIQWHFYQLQTKYDKKIPSIINLVNVLKQIH